MQQDYKHPITPPPPHLLKKFSTQAQDETKKRNDAGYLKTFATLCIEWAMNCQSTSNDSQIRRSDIQPPTELVQQWREEAAHRQYGSTEADELIAEQAAQWGADQELEACCQEVDGTSHSFDGPMLHAARRPKPPSLKEQALEQLRALDQYGALDCNTDKIRRALEQLPDAL